MQLMRDYAARAAAVRSGFDMNPSPGNMRDGLLTDAMKSAGAAQKGWHVSGDSGARLSGVLDGAGAQPAMHARQRRGVRDGASRSRGERWCCSRADSAHRPEIRLPRS